MSSFLTISTPGRGIVKEKMSRFLAFACHADTPEEAREIIARYTNEYHDARHVCWAYMTGADRATWQLNDNGEPSGTAGKPILGQINSAGLTNVVIVVVRYFGGIKLGTPGLIAAYRAAARAAIDNAAIVEDRETATLSFTFPYMAVNNVMSILKQPDITVMSREFDNTCRATISVPLDRLDEITGRLGGVGGVSIDLPSA